MCHFFHRVCWSCTTGQTEMGTLIGHVMAGSFFTFHGICWCMNFIWYHHKTRPLQKDSKEEEGECRKNPRQPQSASSSFFELKRQHDLTHKSWIPITWTRIPVEPLIKMLLPMMVIIVETFFDIINKEGKNHLVLSMYSLKDSNGNLNGVGKLHHILMYGGFMLSGIVDLLSICVKFPKQTSMLFLTLAFGVEALLFSLHTLGRDIFNVEVHFLLLLSVLSCVVFTFLRNFYATNIIVNLGVGSSILLQGVWLIQAGYILFGGFIRESSGTSDVSSHKLQHRYFMFIAACFAWNLFAIAVGNLVLWVAMSACLRSRLLHKRTFRKQTLLSSLKQGLVQAGGTGGDVEERDRLIVEEANEGSKNEVEMKPFVDTHT